MPPSIFPLSVVHSYHVSHFLLFWRGRTRTFCEFAIVQAWADDLDLKSSTRGQGDEIYIQEIGKVTIFVRCSKIGEVQRNASGQGHSTVNFPVRNEGGRCARLLILYGVSVVNV